MISIDEAHRAEIRASVSKDGVSVVSSACIEGERLLQSGHLRLRDESYAAALVNAARVDLALRAHGYSPKRVDVPFLCGYEAGTKRDWAANLDGATQQDVLMPVYLFDGRPELRAAYLDMYTSIDTEQDLVRKLRDQTPYLKNESTRKLLRAHLGARYLILVYGSAVSQTLPVQIGRIVTAFMLGAGSGVGGAMSGAVGGSSVTRGSGAADSIKIGESKTFRTPTDLAQAAVPFKDFPDSASSFELIDLDTNRYLAIGGWRVAQRCGAGGESKCSKPPSDGRSLWHELVFLH